MPQQHFVSLLWTGWQSNYALNEMYKNINQAEKRWEDHIENIGVQCNGSYVVQILHQKWKKERMAIPDWTADVEVRLNVT